MVYLGTAVIAIVIIIFIIIIIIAIAAFVSRRRASYFNNEPTPQFYENMGSDVLNEGPLDQTPLSEIGSSHSLETLLDQTSLSESAISYSPQEVSPNRASLSEIESSHSPLEAQLTQTPSTPLSESPAISHSPEKFPNQMSNIVQPSINRKNPKIMWLDEKIDKFKTLVEDNILNPRSTDTCNLTRSLLNMNISAIKFPVNEITQILDKERLSSDQHVDPPVAIPKVHNLKNSFDESLSKLQTILNHSYLDRIKEKYWTEKTCAVDINTDLIKLLNYVTKLMETY